MFDLLRDKYYNKCVTKIGSEVKRLSPKAGRPKVENRKDIRFSIRLNDETNARLDEYCANHSEKKSDVIRKAILLFLANN